MGPSRSSRARPATGLPAAVFRGSISPGEQQQVLQVQKYRYEPKEPVVREHVQQQRAQSQPAERRQQEQDKDSRRSSAPPPPIRWLLLWLLLLSLTLPLSLRSILLVLGLRRLLLIPDWRRLWLLLLTLDGRASLLRRDLASPSPLRRV